MRLYSLCGSVWPNNPLHCGWILNDYSYGFPLLTSLDIHYDPTLFVSDLLKMYLDILTQRFQTNQVLNQVPLTPVQQHFSSLIFISSNSPTNCLVVVDSP